MNSKRKAGPRRKGRGDSRARGAGGGGVGLAEFQGLIRERYYATDAARGTAGTFLWFIEEVGELATALAACAPGRRAGKAARANLEEEFADVLAWLCTLANINGVELSRAARKYTGAGRVRGVKH